MATINYISPSLINSWLSLTSHPDTASIEDFKNTLDKVPFEPTPAMQKGIDFENEVMEGNHKAYGPYVNGALSQVRIFGMCNGIGISGVIDLLKPNLIADIKYTGRYELNKYLNGGSQHIFYCYVTGIHKFKYLVNKECYVEYYDYVEGSAEKLIDDFINWLKVVGLYEIWSKKWIKEIK